MCNVCVLQMMDLPFEFLFYGHTINEVAITTAGEVAFYLHLVVTAVVVVVVLVSVVVVV